MFLSNPILDEELGKNTFPRLCDSSHTPRGEPPNLGKLLQPMSVQIAAQRIDTVKPNLSSKKIVFIILNKGSR